jgi:hypothetical protein
MRHSAATIILHKGIALQVAQEMLGHSDIRVTHGYSHVSSSLTQDAARRMGGMLQKRSEGARDATENQAVATAVATGRQDQHFGTGSFPRSD